MRSWFAKAAFIAVVLSAGSAWSQARIDQLSAGAPVSGTDVIPNCQGCGVATAAVKTTVTNLVTYFNGVAQIPVATGITGLGTGIATALAVNVGSAGAPVLFNGAGGTPSSLTLANATGLPVAGLPGLAASHFFAGDVGGRPIDASITGDLGCGTAAAGFISCTNTGLQGRAVSSSAPADTNVLAWSASGNKWQPTAAGAGTGNVTAGGTLTNNAIVLGAGTTAVAALGSLGTTTTLLHGNAAGGPTFGAASLTADVSGTLPFGNGGTGATALTNHGVVTAGASALTTVAPGTNGNVLTSNGTDWTSAAAPAGALTTTDGTHSVTSTTTQTFGNGFLVGGSAGSATIATTNTLDTQSGTGAFAIPSADGGAIIVRTNASGGADTIANATGAFGAGYGTTYLTSGFAGNTITPTTAKINNLTALKLGSYQAASIASNGTNYYASLSVPQPATQTGTTFLKDDMTWAAFGALATTTPGTGVATAAAANLSAAGGLTTTVASGTSALGTSAISSATCATVVTTAATGTATTDVVTASFNGDPTAVTGFIPSASGMLSIISYPSSNNVNFKVCNNTAGSITPGAITLNWRVVR